MSYHYGHELYYANTSTKKSKQYSVLVSSSPIVSTSGPSLYYVHHLDSLVWNNLSLLVEALWAVLHTLILVRHWLDRILVSNTTLQEVAELLNTVRCKVTR